MKKIMRLFTAKKPSGTLKRMSELNVESSAKLVKFVNSYHEMERSARKTEVIEMKNKKFESKELYSGFSGKESSTALHLLKVNRSICSAMSKFLLFGIERVDKNMESLAAISNEIVIELDKVLKSHGNRNLKMHCNRVYELEKEADDIFDESMTELFHFFKNPLDILKYKEIYEAIEQICDNCNDACLSIQKS